VVVAIVLLAFFIGPPELGKPPNPSLLANDPAPDWYMLWYYAVLALLPRGMESVFMVAAPVSALVFLLMVPVLWNKGERHPSRRPWAVAAVLTIVLSIIGFWIEGSIAPWSPKFDAKPLPAALVGTTSAPIVAGAQLFHDKACEFCHTVDGQGGMRGPDLTDVAHRLSVNDLRIKIANGGGNMPSFAGVLTHDDLENLVAFLESRVTMPPAQTSSAAGAAAVAQAAGEGAPAGSRP
jgi:ubiquinol-cytochrome c reductase cytochrome b subunit